MHRARARALCLPVTLNDLYSFDPAAGAWAALSPSGPAPAPRYGAGFAATPDGTLYVFGGQGDGECAVAGRVALLQAQLRCCRPSCEEGES